MLLHLAGIFLNVTTPVFALVVIGYLAGPRLGLQARTLSRYSYYILIPALIFNVIGKAEVPAAVATKMVTYIVIVHLACALLGWGVARALGRSEKMIAAYILVAVFGNVGNFGLPIIEFRLGSEAFTAATVYFLAILTTAFIIGVAAANTPSSGGFKVVLAVFKTPALIALVPSLLVNWYDISIPPAIDRGAGLLAAATVPTMLVALGVQLAGMKDFHFSSDVIIVSGIRLLGAPALALLLVIPFGLTGIERGAGIFQAAMPAAVLTSIIAMEYDLIPDFVTTTVLFSTLASVVTLTIVLAVV